MATKKKRELGNSGLTVAPLALGGNVFGWTREKGLGVIPYFPLASGFLTGKYRSEKDLAGRARGDMVKKYLDDRGFRILAALDRVALQYHSAPATVALAWLTARPGITAPIASATSLNQLNELMKSLTLELDPSAIELLNRASA